MSRCKITQEDRQKPRYFREYNSECEAVPIWAVVPLVQILQEKAESLGITFELPEATVKFTLSTMSFSEEDDPTMDEFQEFVNKQWMFAFDRLKDTKKRRSIAEAEAEERSKR